MTTLDELKAARKALQREWNERLRSEDLGCDLASHEEALDASCLVAAGDAGVRDDAPLEEAAAALREMVDPDDVRRVRELLEEPSVRRRADRASDRRGPVVAMLVNRENVLRSRETLRIAAEARARVIIVMSTRTRASRSTRSARRAARAVVQGADPPPAPPPAPSPSRDGAAAPGTAA
jgi:hypothetical protein